MRINTGVLLISLFVILGGCGSVGAPRTDDPPTIQAAKVQIREYGRRFFKDPSSIVDARISTSPLRAKNNMAYPDYWAFCVELRAKNGFGAYNGIGYYLAFFENGRIAEMLGGVENVQTCAAEGYTMQLFPEMNHLE